MQYSIIQKSQLEGAYRLDAEYYQPEFLQVVELIKSRSHKRLGDIISILTDYHANGSYEILRGHVRLSENPDYALMVRAIDLETNDFEDDVRYVSEHAYNFLKKTKLYGNEIIIDKIGNAGEVFLMPDLRRPVTLGMNLFMLRLEADYDPIFVYIFLISKYGKALVYQRITGTVPTSIDKESVRGILIPLPSERLVQEVRTLIEYHFAAIQKAHDLYIQAEDLLLEELGLKDFQVEDDLSFVVNLLDVKSVNRIDADYFQPRYQKLVSKIELKDTKKIGDFVKDYSTGFPFKSENYQEDGIPLIRINNIKKGFIDLSDTAYLSDRDYSLSPKDTAKPGDIVLSMSGTIGMSAVIPQDIPKCSVNQRILRFAPKNVDSDLLVLILNSIVGSYQLERIGTGGVQTNISYRDIQNILIPVLPKETQEKIAELVRKSHEARKKSKELLEEAKRKVEEIIEKGGES